MSFTIVSKFIGVITQKKITLLFEISRNPRYFIYHSTRGPVDDRAYGLGELSSSANIICYGPIKCYA